MKHTLIFAALIASQAQAVTVVVPVRAPIIIPPRVAPPPVRVAPPAPRPAAPAPRPAAPVVHPVIVPPAILPHVPAPAAKKCDPKKPDCKKGK